MNVRVRTEGCNLRGGVWVGKGCGISEWRKGERRERGDMGSRVRWEGPLGGAVMGVERGQVVGTTMTYVIGLRPKRPQKSGPEVAQIYPFQPLAQFQVISECNK